MHTGTAAELASPLESAHANITNKVSALCDRIDELRKRLAHVTISRPVIDQSSAGAQAARATRCSELESLYSHSEQLNALIAQMDQLIESIDI